MERLTEEVQIGPFASLKDKAEAKVGAFADYDCLFAHLTAVTKLKAYEDTGLKPEEIAQAQKAMKSALSLACELQAYRNAAKDGRLFMPPVKVGDMLWPVCWDQVAKVWVVDEQPERVNEVGSKGFFVACCTADPEAPDEFHPYEEIGKTYFMSREDAEAAVVKMEVQG